MNVGTSGTWDMNSSLCVSDVHKSYCICMTQPLYV